MKYLKQEKDHSKALYFARNKADKRNSLDQCVELSSHLEQTGFEVWVMTSDSNYLIFYGK